MSNKNDYLKQRLSYEKYNPTLADLNKYFDDSGFIGDEETRLCLSIAAIRRRCVGVVSSSGTGKSRVVDTLLDLFRENQVYTMEAGSDKSEAYSADAINSSKLIYLTEIQKAGNSEVVTEVLKNLGEGKDYVRRVTKPGGVIEKQVIKSGKAIIYTKAIENKFETDAELDRRYIKLVTDLSEAQTKRVVNSKAVARTNPFRNKFLDDTKSDSLKYHMSTLLNDDANKYVFINPMSVFVSEHIPTTFAISRTYISHYLDFIEGCCFYNKRNRVSFEKVVDGEKKTVLLVSPEDVYQNHLLYNRQFLTDVLQIPPNGMHIFNAFRTAKSKGVKSMTQKGVFNQQGDYADGRTKLTLEQVFGLMKSDGIVMKETVINKMLIDLQMSGYIREDTNQVGSKRITEYYLSNELDNFQYNIDWQAGVEASIAMLKETFPELVDEYINKYCTKPFSDPFTGEERQIVKVNIIPDAVTVANSSAKDFIKQAAIISSSGEILEDSRDDWTD